MGIAAAAAGAVSAIVGGIGGAVTAGLGALGVGEALAGTIGAVAGPALFGAGTGAALGAATGGSPLIGALGGALTGGLTSAPIGGALASSLGVAPSLVNTGIGAAVGAGTSAMQGQSPLMGALMGGAGGYLSSAISPTTAGAAQVDASGTLTNPGTYTGPTVTLPDGSVATNPNAPTYGPPTAAQAATSPGGTAAAGLPGGTASGIAGGKGISTTALALGALSALGGMFNKPQQAPYGNTPGPGQVTANTGPYWNTPLNMNAPGRSPVNPWSNTPAPTTPSGYAAYGGPEQTYFKGNSLLNFGYAKGGALSRVHEQDFRTGSGAGRVRGPGTETSDSIPARLSQHEYVLDAQDVRNIGRGSISRGTKALDRARPQLARGRGPLSRIAA